MFSFPDHAATLEKIAASKGEAFYRGEIARQLEAHSAQNGGVMTTGDLAAHKADWTPPMEVGYRGYTIHELPPNGQGIVALIALGILEHFDLSSHPVDSADSLHLQIEAMKLAFADARRFVADIDWMDVRPESLLDAGYLKGRAAQIDMKKAQDFGHGTPPKGGTVYLTAADASGMMISLIQSNYMGFGSGVVVPGTGVSLQNRGATFVRTPGHPNEVAPRKRPYQTIIPGFVTKDGKPVMSFGVMGGTMQPQGHAQVMVRIADYKQNPQTACDGPRFRVVQGMEVNVEGGFSASVLEELTRRGHKLTELKEGYMDFGSAQMIWKLDGGYVAASDPRRDGQAVGY
jgi:gamma-glutamyltranspeptidase/glutathione hydrolase